MYQTAIFKNTEERFVRMSANRQTAAAIRSLRLSLGLSLGKISARIRVDRMTIHRWEKAEQGISLEMLSRYIQVALESEDSGLPEELLFPFAEALGLPASELSNALARRPLAA